MDQPATNPATISRRLRARGRGRRGFTLVEVLATLLLMGIALPAIMQAVSVASSAAATARRHNEAGTLAESKLAELVASGDWQSGILSGDFGSDWPDYRWDAVVQNWTESTVQQLDVRVSWNDNGGEKSLTLSTLVYAGSASGLTSDSSSSSAGSGSSSGAGSSGTGGSSSSASGGKR